MAIGKRDASDQHQRVRQLVGVLGLLPNPLSLLGHGPRALLRPQTEVEARQRHDDVTELLVVTAVLPLADSQGTFQVGDRCAVSAEVLLTVGQSNQRENDEAVARTFDSFPDAQRARREAYAFLVIADFEHVVGQVVEIGGDVGIGDTDAPLLDAQGPLLQPA